MKPWGSASDNVLSCVKALHLRPCLPDPDQSPGYWLCWNKLLLLWNLVRNGAITW